MFRFIHAADIHLDSPRAGIDQEEGAPVDVIRQAPRRALENLVRFALESNVDFVVIAGDLYDGDWKDFRTGLFFVEQMARLQQADIPVYLIAGNHDAANKMTRTLTLPANVTLFTHREPETLRHPRLDVAIHGQSFERAAVLDDLSAKYPKPVPGFFNVGLLHTCASNSGEHERYAPCTPEALTSKRYDYWALGHVHKRDCDSMFHPGEAPIVFPGNLQGRHIRETGEKGCVLVTVDDDRTTVEFQPLDVFRWELCRIDAGGATHADDVVRRVASDLKRLAKANDDLPLAVRVEIFGACPAHTQLAAEPRRWHNEIRAAALDSAGGQIWVERVTRRTLLPREIDEWMFSDGPIGELVQFIRELQHDEVGLRDLAAELEPLYDQLPHELTEGPDALAFNSPECVQGLLEDVRQLLTQRLAAHGGSE